MSTTAANEAKDREQLHKKFAEMGLRGYWQMRHETERMQPKLWRWKEIYPVLMETTEVIRIGPDAFRRNVGLQTGSKTLSMGFQIVLPGETAAAHRHANTALRFVVKGSGAYTTSNGEPMVMELGDLLIQPNWVWHDHVNNSKEPIIWIDALDAGVVSFLDASGFREEWAEGKQQPLTKTNGASRRLYGPARQPKVEYNGAAGVPYHYKWGEALQALKELADQGIDYRDIGRDAFRRRFQSQPLPVEDSQRLQQFHSISQRAGARLVGRRATGERDRAGANRDGAARPVPGRVFGSELFRNPARNGQEHCFCVSPTGCRSGWKRFA